MADIRSSDATDEVGCDGNGKHKAVWLFKDKQLGKILLEVIVMSVAL